MLLLQALLLAIHLLMTAALLADGSLAPARLYQVLRCASHETAGTAMMTMTMAMAAMDSVATATVKAGTAEETVLELLLLLRAIATLKTAKVEALVAALPALVLALVVPATAGAGAALEVLWAGARAAREAALGLAVKSLTFVESSDSSRRRGRGWRG